MEVSRFARTGHSGIFGKLNRELKIRIDDETGDVLDRPARDAGMSTTEFVRDVLMVRAHGVGRIQSMYEARMKAVSGTGTE